MGEDALGEEAVLGCVPCGEGSGDEVEGSEGVGLGDDTPNSREWLEVGGPYWSCTSDSRASSSSPPSSLIHRKSPTNDASRKNVVPNATTGRMADLAFADIAVFYSYGGIMLSS